MNAGETLRVIVAEDQAVVRAGLVLILDAAAGIAVVGQAADGEEAVALGRALRPDVVLMDVRMPRLDGISATRALTAIGLDVLVLTTFDLDEYVFGALRAGAAGFLLKTADAERLVEAVRLVARGDGFVAPEVTRRLIATFAGPVGSARADVPEVSDAALASLTRRERDVLTCLGRGLSNQLVAAELDMAEATAKTHVSRILAKLGLRSRVQAAILAGRLDSDR